MPAYPYPELLEPGYEWEVVHSKRIAKVNQTDHKMVVSCGEMENDISIRLHELGHVKWSRPMLYKIAHEKFGEFGMRITAAAEDLRINSLLVKAAGTKNNEYQGMLELLSRKDAAAIKQYYKAASLAEQTLMLIATLYTQDHPVLEGLSCRRAIKLAKRAEHFLWLNGLPTTSRMFELVEWLLVLFKDAQNNDMTRGMDFFRTAKGKGKGKYSRIPGIEKQGEWGEFEIIEPRRTQSINPKKNWDRRRKRAVEAGSILRYPGRWCSDRSVFSDRRKSPVGSILVDASGSMDLRSDHIDRLMSAAPATTLAFYNENGLLIYAKNKRSIGLKASECDYMFGENNAIDGPSLEWLAKQKKPRFWISDGGVTGVTDACYVNLASECLRTIKRYQIKQVLTIDDMFEVLEGKQKPLDHPYLRALS